VAYHVPAPPLVSTVVPRKIFAASPSFPAMALIPNPLPVRCYGQSAHACAHQVAALSIKTAREGKGHFRIGMAVSRPFR
jgi:hypothetical protein